ncbi:hypothetical protein NM688_g3425 [Phlebia brevispora]|uniref:Uncharacterized protein n=1 Tax=Phlebia brevispora TaxID=194682 RepID=A0ACC1T5Q3_9APHY|nr:hypothetical protein NM688_g3425 [Phlebia brevispora]
MLLYKQSFYRVDVGNPAQDMGAERRAQMAKATMVLCRNQDVVLATCCGGREASEPPEISLVVHAEQDAEAMIPRVREALEAQGLKVGVAMEEDVRYHTFTDDQLENIEKAVRVDNIEEANHAIDVCCALPMRRAEVGPMRTVPGIPISQIVEPFSVTGERYARMKAATADEIEDEVRSLMAAFEALSSETKTNAAVVMMIADGVLTIGREMWSAYQSTPWGGTITMWLGELITAAGGIQAIIPIALAIAAVLGLLFVLLKE